MTARVPLSGPAAAGRYAVVDENDLELVQGITWHVTVFKHTRITYARGKAPGRRYILMHRLIMQPPHGMVIDHIDGDGLNNSRANLRICSHRENLIHGIERRGRESMDALWEKWQGLLRLVKQPVKTRV